MKHLLLTIALLCLTLLPAGAEPYAQIPPPQLVPCKSPTNCDRNPKHLEAFVEGFYRWYVQITSPKYMIPFSTSMSSIEKQKYRTEIRTRYINEQRVFKQSLSPELYRFWSKIQNSTDLQSVGDYSNACINNATVDFFLCTQTSEYYWAFNTDAQILKMHDQEVFLKVTMPIYETTKDGKPYTPHTLLVTLHPIQEFWRITAIRSSD